MGVYVSGQIVQADEEDIMVSADSKHMLERVSNWVIVAAQAQADHSSGRWRRTWIRFGGPSRVWRNSGPAAAPSLQGPTHCMTRATLRYASAYESHGSLVGDRQVNITL